MGDIALAELAAIVATGLAVVGAWPQLRHCASSGDVRGVSTASPGIGVATELTWLGYALHEGLWSAVPEAGLMAVSNVALLVVMRRAGAPLRTAVVATAVWTAVIASTAAVVGTAGLAVLLAAAYGVQVGPAVWTSYRTAVPTGVAASTWVLLGVEAALWFVYGLAKDDPAVTWFGILGAAASAAILLRKATTRHRVPAFGF